jgi:HPt (histidine-containing phosphotransfer) domain-containing protein
MKSSAMDFGATTLAALCSTLESQCREGSVEEAAAQVSNVASEYDQAQKALEKTVAELIRS